MGQVTLGLEWEDQLWEDDSETHVKAHSRGLYAKWNANRYASPGHWQTGRGEGPGPHVCMRMSAQS